MEIVPRRRSREEQQSDQADVPMSIRRRFSSQEPQEQVPLWWTLPLMNHGQATNPACWQRCFREPGPVDLGVELAEDGCNRTHFADSWQVHEETWVVVRIHDTPRTALFSPDPTDDCPVPKEKSSGVRVTNLTDRDGSTQTMQDCFHSEGEGHRTSADQATSNFIPGRKNDRYLKEQQEKSDWKTIQLIQGVRLDQRRYQ